MREGDEVIVTLPGDVQGWYHPAGAAWLAVVVYVNGNIEPVPIEWCVVQD